MNQIWTNPSVQRSLIKNNRILGDLIYCLKLKQVDESDNSKEVIIFPNMEYIFTFYDPSYGKIYRITGLVEDVYEDQIKIKYINNISTTSNISYSKPMPTCNCILNPPDVSKYEGISVLFIPIANIINVSYITSTEESINKDNGGVHVMLLGISATAIRAIIVRLAFFEDNIENAVKYVDLKAGNIYDIAYESNDGAIYESRAKVISIEEVTDGEYCKPGKGYVREHVGCHNSTYVTCNCSKDEFMQSPPVKKIKIVVDTSETFTGRYEVIMLDTIRDCVLVSNNTDDNEYGIDEYCANCDKMNGTCNPNNCGHYLPPKQETTSCNCNKQNTYMYNYPEFISTIVVDGENISLNHNGKTTEITLEDLVKYYLGIG